MEPIAGAASADAGEKVARRATSGLVRRKEVRLEEAQELARLQRVDAVLAIVQRLHRWLPSRGPLPRPPWNPVEFASPESVKVTCVATGSSISIL